MIPEPRPLPSADDVPLVYALKGFLGGGIKRGYFCPRCRTVVEQRETQHRGHWWLPKHIVEGGQ